jgi:hypothetical protein
LSVSSGIAQILEWADNIPSRSVVPERPQPPITIPPPENQRASQDLTRNNSILRKTEKRFHVLYVKEEILIVGLKLFFD